MRKSVAHVLSIFQTLVIVVLTVTVVLLVSWIVEHHGDTGEWDWMYGKEDETVQASFSPTPKRHDSGFVNPEQNRLQAVDARSLTE